MMQKGDAINGYVLTTDAQGGGGQCEWAFAKKDGEAFFIKRFLKPVYALPSSPGSEKTKADRRARGDEFERHQRQIMRKLGEISGEGGNLVVARQFFREGTHYFKVTLKVDVSRTGPSEIAKLARDDRILIMLTAAKSLETLHRAGLVHGDVKPDNLLVKALAGGGHAIKVIDFDDCFTANHPAPAEQLVGDTTYYSPELYLYHVGDGRGDVLDDKTDVFALGLVFWQYLTGTRPSLPADKPYAAQAVLAGTRLTLPKSVRDVPVAEVVEAMLAREASDRPSMSEVHNSLKMARKSVPEGAVAKIVPRDPSRPDDKPSVLGGKLFRRRAAGSADPGAPAEDGRPLPGGPIFRIGGAPVSGFAPGSTAGAEGVRPDPPTVDAAPPREEASPGGRPAWSDGEGAKIGGTLKGKIDAAASVVDPTTSGKFGGTLWRKASTSATPIFVADSAPDTEAAVAPDAGAAAEAEPEDEEAAEVRPLFRLRKRRE